MLRKVLLVVIGGSSIAWIGFLIAEGFGSENAMLFLAISLCTDLLWRFLDWRRDRATQPR